jgi:hypothetical protein
LYYQRVRPCCCCQRRTYQLEDRCSSRSRHGIRAGELDSPCLAVDFHLDRPIAIGIVLIWLRSLVCVRIERHGHIYNVPHVPPELFLLSHDIFPPEA